MNLFLTEIFCQIDDFCKSIVKEDLRLLGNIKKRKRRCRLGLSEVMTIILIAKRSGFRNFKRFYLERREDLLPYFPGLVSYNRFVELQKETVIPFALFMKQVERKKTDIYIADSTTIKTCHILREKQHKLFKGIAKKSKSTMGWYIGMKLHMVINTVGECMSFSLSSATTDDRKQLPSLMRGLRGLLFADKGYLGKEIAEKMKQQGIELITRAKKNMKQKALDPMKEFFMKKRRLVETVFDQLKNTYELEHTRHRSIAGAFVHILSVLGAYFFQERKPSIKLPLRKLMSS